LNRNIWCIEILEIKDERCSKDCLNRNIWCIEIAIKAKNNELEAPWTETYDVLKLDFFYVILSWHFSWTETYDVLKLTKRMVLEVQQTLNRNIWCIEIRQSKRQEYTKSDLNRNIWCIEIKIFRPLFGITVFLNRNIWCIEIMTSYQI